MPGSGKALEVYGTAMEGAESGGPPAGDENQAKINVFERGGQSGQWDTEARLMFGLGKHEGFNDAWKGPGSGEHWQRRTRLAS